MKAERDPASAAVSSVLSAGVGASLVLMASGLALCLLRGGPLPAAATPASALGAGLRALDAGALMSLGLLVLLATPAARVVVLIWQFARKREWVFVAVSTAVFAILAASVLAGRGE
jgi:uncharacterized membrane protein